MLYGAALMLEFVTAGGAAGPRTPDEAGVSSAGWHGGRSHLRNLPLGLLLLSLVESDRETILGMNGLLFGMIIVLAGFAMYYPTRKSRPASRQKQLRREQPAD